MEQLASSMKDKYDQAKENFPQNPFLFILGCPRSGTTLLQRMLNHHPQLAVVNEARFIPLALQDPMVRINPPLTPELVERVCGYKRFPLLGLSDTAVCESEKKARTYADFISSLFTEFGKLQGKPLAGDKTPFYSLHIPLLHALFPWAKFIHIIRDGRDIALSTFEWREEKGPGNFNLWAEEPAAVIAMWWKWRLTTARQTGKELRSEIYCEVYYEDLVAKPEETLRDLSDFLNLPFASEMLFYYEGKTNDKPGLSSKKRWLPPTQGLREWRTHMTKRDIELFEALAGDLLSELGYERIFNKISPEITAVGERCQELWNSEMERRQAKAGNSAMHPPEGYAE